MSEKKPEISDSKPSIASAPAIPAPTPSSDAASSDKEKPKEGHKSLTVILIIGVILLLLAGLGYFASTCSVSIPGLSSLFGCDIDDSSLTDQGIVVPDDGTTGTDSTTLTP